MAAKRVNQPLLSERDRSVLFSLPSDQFVRPMDVGGTDGSYHSATLYRLSELGLVERKRWAGHVRRSYRYRRVAILEALIAFAKRYAGYGCAGIGQDLSDTTLCGKCGPCEAHEFLRLNGLDT